MPNQYDSVIERVVGALYGYAASDLRCDLDSRNLLTRSRNLPTAPFCLSAYRQLEGPIASMRLRSCVGLGDDLVTRFACSP